MGDLTLKEMDSINYLLTEVSLELLGNNFFNIFGENVDSINELLTGKENKQDQNYSERACQLLNAINVSIFDINQGVNNDDNTPINKELETKVVDEKGANNRKRRASISGQCVENQNDSQKSDDSFVMPTPNSIVTTRSGRVIKRRFTILEERPSAKSIATENTLPTLTPKPKTVAVKATTDEKDEKDEMNEKIEELKAKTETELLRLKLWCDVNKQSFERSHPTRSDYNEVEEVQLMRMCKSLIEFMKYIKADAQDNEKMSKIADCILLLKESL